MFTQMITETLLGALTGYVTNHTAIRSLFKPGGMVEQTQADFAREAGRLLEDQVLTREVLARQLQLPQVQQLLAQALEAFLQEQLPQALAGQQLSSLPGGAERTAFLQELLTQFVRQEREQILLLLKKYFPLQQLLTERQCQQMADQLEQVLVATLRQEEFLLQFWQQYGQATLEKLGLASLCQAVLRNGAAISRQWPQQFRAQYEAELERALLQTIQKLQLRPVLLELDQQMAGSTVGQYLRCDSRQLQALLCAAAASEQGKHQMAALAEQLVRTLETVSVPVAQLLPPELLTQLKPLLQQQTPLLLAELLTWLEQNRQSVNAMLERAVDEVAAEAGGMKGMLLEQLKETLLQQFLQQEDLRQLLQNLLTDSADQEKTAALLLDKLTVLLQSHSLGELVQRLNREQRLVQAVQIFLQENLQRFLQQSGLQLAERILAWQPGALRLVERQPELERWLASWLLRQLEKADLAGLLERQCQTVGQLTLEQLLHTEADKIAAGMEQLVRKGCQQLAEHLPQVPAERLYRQLYDGVEQLLAQYGGQWLQQLAASRNVETLLRPFLPWLAQQQPQLLNHLTAMGLTGVQGRLSQLAEAQIGQLSKVAMLKLVEDFMGQELQPLNYLGAAMGAAAGATVGTALSMAAPAGAAASSAALAGVIAGKAAVFGAVGYGTNCAAVKGLFWPYEPVGGVEMLQGVIPKQRARFAHSMGQLIDRYVINEEMLAQMLQQSRPQWLAYGEGLAVDRQLAGRLAAELAAGRKPLARVMLERLAQWGQSDAKAALERLGGMPLAFLCDISLKEGKTGRGLLEKLQQGIVRQLQGKMPLEQLVSAEQAWQWLYGWLCRQPLPDLQPLVQSWMHGSHTLEQTLSADGCRQLQDGMQLRITAWMAQPVHQRMLAERLGSWLQGQQLQRWLADNGAVWIEQNLASLFRLLEQTLLPVLQSKQGQITAAAQQAILNRLGLMQQMGYTMLGGDEIVAQVVERVLQQQLPIFLSVKSRELQQLCCRYGQQHLIPALLHSAAGQAQVQPVLQALLAQPALHQWAGQTGAQVVGALAAQPVRTWGRWLKLEPYLSNVQLQLGFQWQRHGAAALQIWQPLVEDFYRRQIGPLALGMLTRGWDGQLPLAELLTGREGAQLWAAFQLRLRENLAVTRPQQWLDWPQAAVGLEQSMTALLQGQDFRRWLDYESQLLVLRLTEGWEQLLPEAARAALLRPAVEAVYRVAQRYGCQLLAMMELPRLAEQQLNAMDSAHLEQVVRGFASSYLTHIENRGWLGAVFALPGMLLYLL